LSNEKVVLYSFLLYSLILSAQDGIVKSVMLDSVMVSAVSSGFSVEDFVDYG